jgi:hypothetical protein
LRQARLTECPVCHCVLEGAEEACASCTSELVAYRNLLATANSLMLEAYNAVLRGETATARELGKKALEVSPLLSEQNLVLQARIALAEKRYSNAVEHIELLPEDNEYRRGLLDEAACLQAAELRGMERYNIALTSARKGHLSDAYYHAGIALELAPYEAAVWRLAIKVALMSGKLTEAEQMVGEAVKRFPEDQFIAKLAYELSATAK